MATTPPTLLLWLDEARDIEKVLAPRLGSGSITIISARRGAMPSLDQLADTEIVFGWDLPKNIFHLMPRLRWIQAATGGVENWLIRDDIPTDVILTCARGIHRIQMPENILAALFHVTKNFAYCYEMQARHTWTPTTFDLLAGKTLGIVGLGAIGAELARKAAFLEMRVIGVRKSLQPVPSVEQVYPLEQLDAVLEQSDYLVLVAPLTVETNNLMNAERFSKMKPRAWLLNFARGELVVDEDLVAALRDKKIAGAVLDAFRQEPLPTDHPFWSNPNISILPHLGGKLPSKHVVFAGLLAGNIARYLAGKPLDGIVDFARGY